MKKNKKIYNPNMVFGINGCLNVLTAKKLEIVSIQVMIGGNAEHNKLINKHCNEFSHKVQKINKKEFLNRYSGLRTQGIVVLFKGKLYKQIPDFSNANSNFNLLILDNIEDPQNFGQIIRTAECAGVDGIVIPEHNSVDLTNTAIQISQGAFVHISIYKCVNINRLISDLKEQGFWIVGFENSINAKEWYNIDYNEKLALIFGSEGKGIRKKTIEKCDFLATIPMQGKISSLNVSATISAVMFERLRQISSL
tara:strand:- start:9450 stop:10205 length:756 start_codon:yes stop_codon:yes gene_type:complete